jgi:hypothetical protein
MISAVISFDLDTSMSAVLSGGWLKDRAAVSWSMPASYLASNAFPDPYVKFDLAPNRWLTDGEDALMFEALKKSSELLYLL